MGKGKPPLYLPAPMHLPPPVLANHLHTILAVLLSLKKRPVIRWERMSQAGRKLGTEIQVGQTSVWVVSGDAKKMQAAMQHPPYRELFEFRPTAGPSPLLLILGEIRHWRGTVNDSEQDRRNDPVTPLLSQWTYQAMVHELCGISNGRVRIEHEDKLELRVGCYVSENLSPAQCRRISSSRPPPTPSSLKISSPTLVTLAPPLPLTFPITSRRIAPSPRPPLLG